MLAYLPDIFHMETYKTSTGYKTSNISHFVIQKQIIYIVTLKKDKSNSGIRRNTSYLHASIWTIGIY